MKGGFLVILVSLVILGLVACSSPAPTTTAPAPTTTAPAPTTKAPTPTTTAPAPTTTTAPTTTAAKVILLRVSVWPPATADAGWGSAWPGKQLEARSNGRVKAEFYFASTLTGQKTMLDGVRAGVCDIAAGVHTPAHAGAIPLMTITNLPMMSLSQYQALWALNEYIKLPEVKAELDRNNVLITGNGAGVSDSAIASTVPIKNIADIRGKKINTAGVGIDVVTAAGAVTMIVPMTESYDALSKGTIDAIEVGAAGIAAYRIQEVAKYFYACHLGCSISPQMMNKDTFAKLPADIQKIVIDLIPENYESFHAIYETLGTNLRWLNEVKPASVVTEVTPDDFTKLTQLAQNTAWARWVSDMTAKGLPGQRMLESWITFNARALKEHPLPSDESMVAKYKPYYDLPRK